MMNQVPGDGSTGKITKVIVFREDIVKDENRADLPIDTTGYAIKSLRTE